MQTRTRITAHAVLILGTAATGVIVPTQAFADTQSRRTQPTDVSRADLGHLAADVLTIENAVLLSGDARSAALAAAEPATTATAAAKLAARRAVQADRDYARQLAGTIFTGVSTTVRVTRVTGTASRRVADVVEETAYTVDGSESKYSYTARHRIESVWDGGWKVADFSSLDYASPFSDAQLAGVSRVPSLVRRAAISQRVTTFAASLERNRTSLADGDAAKLANRRVPVALDDASAEKPMNLRHTEATVAPVTSVGRPADKPLPTPREALRPMGGEGPPYNYAAMVDFALYYAVDHPVFYTRDENDCTTFVSWALWTGGYAEAGAQDYPAVGWNHDDDDVWYWRCNSCSPRHSYTWGGATNWNIYESNYGGRATFLPYLSDLLISDVMQLDIDGYGGQDAPDHTMMVTDRGADGWPLLSHHSNDTKNKPLWDILAMYDGPYWAVRT
jgi:hypothetical protein